MGGRGWILFGLAAFGACAGWAYSGALGALLGGVGVFVVSSLVALEFRNRRSAQDAVRVVLPRSSVEGLGSGTAGAAGQSTGERDAQQAALARMVTFGAAKANQASAAELHLATLLGGLIAGFSERPREAPPTALLAAANRYGATAAMAPEVSEIMTVLKGRAAVGALVDAADPLFEVVGLVLPHPAMTNLARLCKLKPTEAAVLSAASGVLLALRIRVELPALARAVLESSRED